MGLLTALFTRHPKNNSTELLEAIAGAVDQVNPVLKQVSGYPDRYCKSISRAVQYAQHLAAQIPGPVTVSPEPSVKTPLVRALFPVQGEACVALQRSRDTRHFFQNHPDATGIYALMCMRRKTKAQLGMAMEGEILRRDVPQEIVYFTDYTVADPGLTESESRQQIARGFFDSLIVHVVNRIEARKQRKDALAQERDELLGQLRTAPAANRQEYEKRLKRVLRQMVRLVASLDLGRYYKDFDAVLLHADQYLYLEQTKINLDSMGVVRSPATSDSDEIMFHELVGRDRRRWTVMMMCCNQIEEQLTITDRLEEAQRWLGF